MHGLALLTPKRPWLRTHHPAHTRAARHTQLYEVAWSTPRGVRLLDTIMAPDHAQQDAVWQPARLAGVGGVGGGGGAGRDEGRRRLKRGILAYRAAYPDIKCVRRSCCRCMTVCSCVCCVACVRAGMSRMHAADPCRARVQSVVILTAPLSVNIRARAAEAAAAMRMHAATSLCVDAACAGRCVVVAAAGLWFRQPPRCQGPTRCLCTGERAGA
jgi:hypothetical protein